MVAAGAYYTRLGRIDLARIHKAALCTGTLCGPWFLWKFHAPVLALWIGPRTPEIRDRREEEDNENDTPVAGSKFLA